ncbi:MAG: hypothetical protein HFJ55_02170 [Clostridia bacterium]|nr:hypothetical protein [Clostridia bacterium]
MKRLRIVDKLQFIKATSITVLVIIEFITLLNKIQSCGLLWFFTTLR